MNFKLDSSGDLIIGRGVARVDGKEYTAQLIKNKLKTLLGEWKLNTTVGLPWFDKLLGANYDFNLIYSWVYKTLLDTPGVTKVVLLEVGKIGRTGIVAFNVDTIHGNITESLEV